MPKPVLIVIFLYSFYKWLFSAINFKYEYVTDVP
jgi:hypothetical protein